jgi:hypothetical protein
MDHRQLAGGTTCPAGWLKPELRDVSLYNVPLLDVALETYWAFPIWQRPAYQAYAFVSGNLVTDQPHTVGDSGDTYALKTVFAAGAAEHDPSNAARWTELHSPDIIRTEAAGPPEAPAEQPYQLTGALAVSGDQAESLIRRRLGPRRHGPTLTTSCEPRRSSPP